MAAENNTRDLQAFSRIFEVMSFVDRIQELSPEEIEETAHRLCQLSGNISELFRPGAVAVCTGCMKSSCYSSNSKCQDPAVQTGRDPQAALTGTLVELTTHGEISTGC